MRGKETNKILPQQPDINIYQQLIIKKIKNSFFFTRLHFLPSIIKKHLFHSQVNTEITFIPHPSTPSF
jgi:hypothetical protein